MKYLFLIILIIQGCNNVCIERQNGDVKPDSYFSPRTMNGIVEAIGITGSEHSHLTTTVKTDNETLTFYFKQIRWKVGDTVNIKIIKKDEAYVNDTRVKNILYLR